jgi:hypothetical protein
MYKLTDEMAISLQTAILQQAVTDWKYGGKQTKEDLERWFLSVWGQFLSGDKGEYIIETLKKGKHKYGWKRQLY